MPPNKTLPMCSEVLQIFIKKLNPCAKQLSKVSNLSARKTHVKLAELNVSLVKEIATAKAETIKWGAGMLVAQGAVVANLVKLL